VRRLLIGPLRYFRELGQTVAQGWKVFFFAPADPTSLGCIRIAVGLLAFWSLFVYGLDLPAFLGSTAWADVDSVRHVQGIMKPWAWSFWFSVPDALLRPVWAACLVVLLLFVLGLWSRVTAVLSWVIVVSTANRAPVSLFGFDQIVSTWLLYLAATGASGQAVSLDRFFGRWRQARAIAGRRRGSGGIRWDLPRGVPEPSISANLALRLIQLHLCVIYGTAGLAKLQGTAWWNGLAIWGTLASGEFRLLDFTWIAAYPLLLNVLTHGALALEVVYPALIWVPIFRPLFLALIVTLHLGIGVTAPGLTEFALAMIAGNLAFVSGGWLRSLVTGLDRSHPSGKVLYDGQCPRCRASVAVLVAADPDRVIEPLDLTVVDVGKIHPTLTREACMKAMHVVRADGRVFAGFDAVVVLARWLPLFWLAGVLGSLPGVRFFGRRAYQMVADSRPREGCTDDVCSIHAPQRAEAKSANEVAS
jgi:predicted DCC family thiol-disulfide oxidoreductase YuxK